MDSFLNYTYLKDMREVREKSFSGWLTFFAKFGSDDIKNHRL